MAHRSPLLAAAIAAALTLAACSGDPGASAEAADETPETTDAVPEAGPDLPATP